jgi:hypothetical protein
MPQATAQQFTELARRQGDDALMLVSDRLLGVSMLRVGELNDARHCLERMVNRYISRRRAALTPTYFTLINAPWRAQTSRAYSLSIFLTNP